MAKPFRFEVHTPYRLFFSDEVESVVAGIEDGLIGVLAGHSPFAAPVPTGELRIKTADGKWKSAAVSDGILEVTRDRTVVLCGAAEWPDEIDRARAEDAKRRAEERLGESMMKYESERASASLARAVNRLKVKDRAGDAV